MFFDSILAVLSDGQPHSFTEIMDELKSGSIHSEKQVGFCLSFLNEYGFVELLSDGRWQLRKSVVCFLQQLTEMDA